MAVTFFPLQDLRGSIAARNTLRAAVPDQTASPGVLQDALGRPLRDLRISVTDRCNFRCSYCMPKEVFDSNYRFLPHAALLSFEEITRLARTFVGRGVRKLRLTGGEPLLRKHIEGLVEMLAVLRTPEGDAVDLTLTTNGSLLARKAHALAQAGLARVTVSLDALDDAVFQRMNDVGFPVADVLAGIDAALAAGLRSVKVNMVVKRGTNDQQILPMADHFRRRYGPDVTLRFIEYMDVGASNGWRMDQVVPSSAVLELIRRAYPVEPVLPGAPGETAARWRYVDGRGEIGLISSVTQAFCRDCNRARLSTEGRLFTCLFATQGHDLRSLLRGDATDADLAGALASLWQARADRYSELRGSLKPVTGEAKVEMHYIGG